MMKFQTSATAKPQNIDEYISAFPEDVQKTLELVRSTIKKAAPGAEETISYGMPTFNLNKIYLIYFAGYKKHIAIYPAPSGDKELKEILAPFMHGKGTVQFPLDKPMPIDLITKVVKQSIKENLERTAKAEK